MKYLLYPFLSQLRALLRSSFPYLKSTLNFDTSEDREASIVFDILNIIKEKDLEEDKFFMIDVGANNGISGSNSNFLIKKGIRAILIDLIENSIVKCDNIYKLNTKVKTILSACGAEDEKIKIYTSLDGSSDSKASALGHIDKLHHDKKERDFIVCDQKKISTIIEDCLKSNFINSDSNFAVLSIDTEGYDLEVLKGLGKFKPQIIISEFSKSLPLIEYEKRKWLIENGYFLIKTTYSNCIFLKNEYSNKFFSNPKNHKII